MSVVIETTIGDITVDLYLKERPNTCLNFLKLCKIKYYNLCLFYKIEKNFIAQSGDPTATGRGGESIFCHLYGDQAKYFDAEFKPRLKHSKLGTLSMVNNGNNMNGSQFFITLSENLTYLDENHTVFGEVAEGFDILLKLNDAICDSNNRPYKDIRITHTVVLHDPFEDPAGLEIPDASPEPTQEMLESNYIRADEEIDDNKGKSAEEIEEKIKESEAKARATILEMVGDIPDAEVKPPENVLFVCKLNPVTTSEDLEIIFSRFGKILSCEVIKDKKTGDSLQYAFIEFEREEDCEAAYFKMDNVLIDDRRIHVDFSQSVSKMFYGKDKFQSRSKPAKSNISLKNTERNDGYDLIFDMEEDRNDKKLPSKSKVSAKCKKSKHSSHSEEKEHEKRKEQSSYEKSYKHDLKGKDKRCRDEDQYSKYKDRYTSQSKERNSEGHKDSKIYRNSDYHKKSPESNEYRSSRKKSRHDSPSHERLRKSQDHHGKLSSYDSCSSKMKHSVSPYVSYSSRPKQSVSPESSKMAQDPHKKQSSRDLHSSKTKCSASLYVSHSSRLKQSVSPENSKKAEDRYEEQSHHNSSKKKYSVSPDRFKKRQYQQREQSPCYSHSSTRKCSVSPDMQISQHKKQFYSSKAKHSDKTDSEDELVKVKKSKYFKEDKGESSKSDKQKSKKHKLAHLSEKRKKSKVSRSSSSSSSSDSSSSSSSSSSYEKKSRQKHSKSKLKHRKRRKHSS